MAADLPRKRNGGHAAGSIVVRLDPEAGPKVADADDPLGVLQDMTGGRWGKRFGTDPERPPKLLFPTAGAGDARKLIAADPDYRPAGHEPVEFLSYLLVHRPPVDELPPETLQGFLDELVHEIDAVEIAYVELPAGEPAHRPDDTIDDLDRNDLYPDWQPELKESGEPSRGIGLSGFWHRSHPHRPAERTGWPGGHGAGIRVVDIERGWHTSHPDLATQPIAVFGTMLPESQLHGTKTLGVLCAAHDDGGIIGAAPYLDRVDAVSWHGSTRANTILAAVLGAFPRMKPMGPGDILLLEMQLNPQKASYDPVLDEDLAALRSAGYGHLPVEALDADFKAIAYAVSRGVTVIEAAGNGKVDLDLFQDPTPGPTYAHHFFERRKRDSGARDSGAILVAAADWGYASDAWVPHATSLQGTNFGSRIDCFAKNGIYTTLSGTADEVGPAEIVHKWGYYDSTSGASALIAGAAACLQGAAKASSGLLDPGQMRDILGDASAGSPNTRSRDPDSYSGDRIGVMPDLAGLGQKYLKRP